MSNGTHRHEFDVHLSAENIDKETITAIERLGYKQDDFHNNRNSAPPSYHASYHKHLSKPCDALWRDTTEILWRSPTFRGCLEEELFGCLRYEFDTHDASAWPFSTSPFPLEKCKPGEHKECDIHVSVDLKRAAPSAIAKLEELNMISFDRNVVEPREVDLSPIIKRRRVYSLTFEDVELGEQVFHRLYGIIRNLPGLNGKMKLEQVTRFLVRPSDAEQLPIVRNAYARAWLSS